LFRRILLWPRGNDQNGADAEPEYLAVYLDGSLTVRRPFPPQPKVYFKFTVHHTTDPQDDRVKGAGYVA
jgi:hypothetical protein